MRAVVIGASSGLGRCIAVGLGKRGARVAVLSRRIGRLEETAREIGSGTPAIACDATDPASARSAVARAAEALGGIDGLVYAPGIGHLSKLVDTDPELWRRTFDTNVIGASTVTAAAMPHLEATKGTAVYLSTISASSTPPWPGLGSYAASKAALDKMVEAWQNEHPSVGFTRVSVGECVGGEGDSMVEFNKDWDHGLAAELAPSWLSGKYMSGGFVDVEELVHVVDAVLRIGPSASIPSITLAARVHG
jgi:NAD(P)-dependent dehydrogenase (short-subunit alcohol dehydrogenase family)